MSGPKSYSVEVFDKNLKTLFLLQNDIVNLWQYLSSIKISDSARKIEINCSDFLKKHLIQFQNLNNPFIENLEGEINQEQFDKFYNRVHAFIEKQQKFKQVLDEKKLWFKALEDDYKYYLETEELVEKYHEDFIVLKNQMLDYIDSLNLDDAIKKEKISEIRTMIFSFKHPPFTAEIAKKLESFRTELIDSFEEARKKLGTISTPGSQMHSNNKAAENVKLISPKNIKNDKQSQGEIEATIHKIEVLLNGLVDEKHKKTFADRLLNLRRDIKTNNKYFLVELHEEIIMHRKQQAFKGDLLRLNRELSAMTFVSSISSEIQKFKTRIVEALESDVIKQQDLANIRAQFESLVEKNKVLTCQKQIAARERKYIKSRLVAALHDLNYDVVSDSKVIDLDAPDALLFQDSGRQNFINLRFDNSGQLLYNYLIPEDRNELSYDEQAIKMAGLEETCNEFKKMLADLKKQGLHIELKNEIPITEKALIRLPEKYRKLIKQVEKKDTGSTRVSFQNRKMNK